uniref:Uncharacterized protein n=1 Tax=Eucampia antarctica TaxID=49252 RepID=A0A7S2SKQ0_9STRA
MRNVQKHTSPLHSKHQNHPHDSHYTVTNQNEQAENKNISIMSWASQWKGPQRVIFGHDAKRGLQLYYFPSSNKKEKKDIMVAGLDTGACYGKKLTGIMLPSQTLVHVPSQKIYCSIDK